MAPYSSSGDASNSPPITSDSPYHIGPPIPEVNSVWFKFYLYQLIQNGPISLLIPKGHRLSHLPKSFKNFDKFLVITWGHDPIVSSYSNLLLTLNDALSHGPILVQCYSENEDSAQTIHIPFNDFTHPLYQHPSVQKLHKKLNLKYFSGYITMLNPYGLNNNENGTFKQNFDEWVLLDLRFGIPLFDNKLNLNILSLFKENNLGSWENLNSMLEANRKLSLELIDFIQKYQLVNIIDANLGVAGSSVVTNNRNSSNETANNYMIPILNSTFNKSINKRANQTIVLYPTQCILFENNLITVLNDL